MQGPLMTAHPFERFQAPKSILHGTPLKEILNANLIRLVGESFTAVHAGFDHRRFQRDATKGLDALEFNERGKQIGLALAARLPQPFAEGCPVLLAALGPELTRTDGNGLAPFFYLPHAHAVAECGVEDFTSGMRSNYEITKRFTAEFSLRPFLARYRDESLRELKKWARDSNPHVRRLVSEGTRPRLPWAMRLKEFQADPQWTLPLLELLKDDPELYVRRSVANHLADILKDHPEVGMDVAERWLKEAFRKKTPTEMAASRKWLIRHAVRLPAKKGDARAIALRLAAK